MILALCLGEFKGLFGPFADRWEPVRLDET
jgi:hypothetical protein